MKKISDYVKASRRGSREAEFENSTGWVGVVKIHKSKKTYDRKKNAEIVQLVRTSDL